MNETTMIEIPLIDVVVNPRYWVCIIGPVGRDDKPEGFDSIPRSAAIEAIEKAGINIKDCWSGWGCDKKHFDKIMKVWNEE